MYPKKPETAYREIHIEQVEFVLFITPTGSKNVTAVH